MRLIYITILFFLYLNVLSQESVVNHIDEISIYSPFSAQKQVGYSITIFTDSILKNNYEELTVLLKKYTGIYVKEQGSGMTASISMRGSSASHTAVYWNGLPINSSLNGQTDFNTLYTSQYNKISIRKGGGSVLLGSGAIGGAINLENTIEFNNKTTGNIHVSGGNYKTFTSFVNIKHSSHDKFAFQLSRGSFLSENNYPYYDSEISNENAEIKHYNMQYITGYELNEKNQFYYKGANTNSDRNTSRTLYAPSNANLLYRSQNNLVGWLYNNTNHQSELKAAFIKEDYIYTFDKDQPEMISDNGSNKWINSYNANYRFNSNIQWQNGIDYEHLYGRGTDILNSNRQKLSLFSALHHKLTNKLYYNLNVRKEWSSVYKIPLVFSFDTKWQWHKRLSTKFNTSTNFRIPTLNDLYWQAGGDPDLKPENNWSAEIGHEILVIDNRMLRSKIDMNVYLSHSKNLIQWMPVSGTIWQPFNVQEVLSKGLDINLNVSFAFAKQRIIANTYYSYTESEDIKNQKQLIYVPKHIGGMFLSYSINKWNIDLSEQYNGSVFTTTSNTESLPDYWLSNISVRRDLLDAKLDLGININNIFNTKYTIVAGRPMPGRNFTILFTYKL